MIIYYHKKNVYGEEKMYVTDKQVRLNVSSLTKKATISNIDIINLKALGHEVVHQPIY